MDFKKKLMTLKQGLKYFFFFFFFERETCNSLIREKDYNRGQETNRLIPGQIEQDMINRVG